MRIFDTHAHYDDEAFDVDRDELLNKLLSTDIDTIVNVGASIEGCRKTLNLAKQYKNIYAAIGVHPDDYDKLNEDIISWLKEEALSNPKVVAIGLDLIIIMMSQRGQYSLNGLKGSYRWLLKLISQ